MLDEALSNVDAENESVIQEALDRLMKDRTTLIIAHRLSSVMHADRIMVLNEGRLVELGNHAELAAEPGPYQRLCEMQGALDASIKKDVDLTEEGPEQVPEEGTGESHG